MVGLFSADAARKGIMILIEPLNHHDAPGYLLQTTPQTLQIIDAVNKPTLKLIFDFYHMQLMEGDLTNRIKKLLPAIGHIRFASVPDRGAPDHSEVNYPHNLSVIEGLSNTAPIDAEHKSMDTTKKASVG